MSVPIKNAKLQSDLDAAGFAITNPAGFVSPAFAGTVDIQQALKATGIISPAQITANQNDYAPTGFSTAVVLRLNSDAARDITGLAGGASGLIKIIHNVGAQPITLKDESGSSTAGNRFALSADVVLTGDSSVFLQYDGTTARWRAIGGTGSAADFSSNTATSVDGEIVLFSGTGGKTGKRATTTGLLKGTSGVLGAAAAGTDYYAPGGTDVAIADGGTGASAADTARSNLGLKKLATIVSNVGTDDTTEKTLWDASVAAASLDANNRSLSFYLAGKIGATANGKTLRLKWGGASLATIYDSGSFTDGSSSHWCLHGTIIRVSSTVTRCIVVAVLGTSTDDTRTAYTIVTSDNLDSSGYTLRLTGQGTAGNDLEIFMGRVILDQ